MLSTINSSQYSTWRGAGKGTMMDLWWTWISQNCYLMILFLGWIRFPTKFCWLISILRRRPVCRLGFLALLPKEIVPYKKYFKNSCKDKAMRREMKDSSGDEVLGSIWWTRKTDLVAIQMMAPIHLNYSFRDTHIKIKLIHNWILNFWCKMSMKSIKLVLLTIKWITKIWLNVKYLSYKSRSLKSVKEDTLKTKTIN